MNTHELCLSDFFTYFSCFALQKISSKIATKPCLYTFFSVFHECQVQGFFEILELKFTFVNEHFNISKVTKKLILVKNALFSLFNFI